MQPETTAQIMAAIRWLPEGDRVRVLQFTLAILESRRGKCQQRAKRFKKMGKSPTREN